jgi:hypothetical protein
MASGEMDRRGTTTPTTGTTNSTTTNSTATNSTDGTQR